MIRSRAAASRAPAAPLRGRFAPPDPAARSQEPAAIRAREHSEARPKTVNGPIAEPLAVTAAMQVSGRASVRLGRSVRAVRTVGAHRRRLHGRPRTGCGSACSGSTCAVEPGLWGTSAVVLMAWRSPAAVCPCPLETPGLMASAVPGRLGAVPRRTGPRRPVTGPTGTRTASGGIGPGAGRLAPTSPAHVPAGQRANIPGIYLCLRGVDLAQDGPRGEVPAWWRVPFRAAFLRNHAGAFQRT